MSYTQEELDAAVSKIVRTEVRRQYGALGNRKVELVFNDLQDAAAGVFISQPNAVFYVVFLAAQRLVEALQVELNLVQDFLETVEATGNRVRPISELTSLRNANQALTQLAQSAADRSSTYTDIESVSAYQRFEKNTQKFLDTAGKNIVKNGGVVQTPGQARERLGTLYRELRSTHADTLRRVELLREAVNDFNTLELQATLSSSVISRAHETLANNVDSLENLPPEKRLNSIRNVVLDILASRAVVKGFGSLRPMTTFLDIEGTGQVFSDSTHPVTPAFVDCDVLDPYPILTDTLELDITLDGDASVTTTVQLQGSFVARAESTITETYDIGAPNTAGVTNNELEIQLVNYPSIGVTTSIPITLTSSATILVGTAVGDINTAITAASPGAGPHYPLIAEAYPQPFRFSGAVDIDVTGSVSDATFTSLNPSVDFTTLSVVEGDYIIVTDPTSVHATSYFTVDAGGVSASALVCSRLFPAGPPPAVDEAAMEIEVGGNIAIRLRVTDDRDAARIVQPSPAYADYRLQALNDRLRIRVPRTDDLQYDTATTLGFFPGSDFISRPVAGPLVARVFNSSFQAAVGGVARVQAEAVYTPAVYDGRGRSEPANFSQVVVSRFQGTGDLTSTGTAVTVAVEGAATAGVVVGDVLGIVASATTADSGLFGAVTAVDDASVTATIAGATTTSDVDVEIGPDLHTISSLDTVIRITSSDGLNDGLYNVLYFDSLQNTFPFQLTIDTPLSLPGRLPGNLPYIFNVEVGRYFMRFSSLDTTLGSAITIDDGGGNPNTGVNLFFGAGSASGVGTTKYFQLPEMPRALEEEDTLELTTVQFDQPSYIGVIEAVERSLSLIEVSPALDVDTAPFTFSQNTPVPFARVRKGRLNNYELFRDLLEDWLELNPNNDTFFDNFNTKLNPLVVNTNPTLSQINDTRLSLQEVSSAIDQLEIILLDYTADVVTEVDNLISSYQQQGADRAVDLVLEAQFSTFFGLDQDEVSYAGTVQKAIKSVARNDLPVRKDNRRGEREGEDALIASYEEPDYEYDTSDIDDVDEPDFNIGQDIEFPNRGY